MRRLALATAVVLGTLVGLYILWELRSVVLVFFLSLWTAAAVRPAIDALRQRGFKRSLSLGIVYGSGVLGLIALTLLTAVPLANELQRLGDDAVASYEHLTEEWANGPPWQKTLAQRLPDPEQLFDDLFRRRAADTLWSALGITFGLLGIVVNLVIVIVLSLYWAIDRVHFERLWLSLLPVEYRVGARSMWRDIEREVGGYLRSEGLQSIAAGLILAAIYYAIDYPYPVLLAVIAAVCWLVPWLGSFFAMLAAVVLAIPMIVLEGLTGTILGAATATILTLGVLLTLEIWVEPRLFERQRYNPLLVIIVVVAMASVFGFLGLILGPPIAAIMQIVSGHLLRERLKETVRSRPVGIESLKGRVAALRAALNDMSDPPPGLLSLVGRLEELRDEAIAFDGALAPDSASPVVYSDESTAPVAANP